MKNVSLFFFAVGLQATLCASVFAENIPPATIYLGNTYGAGATVPYPPDANFGYQSLKVQCNNALPIIANGDESLGDFLSQDQGYPLTKDRLSCHISSNTGDVGTLTLALSNKLLPGHSAAAPAWGDVNYKSSNFTALPGCPSDTTSYKHNFHYMCICIRKLSPRPGLGGPTIAIITELPWLFPESNQNCLNQ